MGVAFVVSIIAVGIALMSDVFFGRGVLDWYHSIDPGTRFMVWLLVLVAVFVGFIMKDDKKDGFFKSLGGKIEKLGEK
jgi:hypothetical protein